MEFWNETAPRLKELRFRWAFENRKKLRFVGFELAFENRKELKIRRFRVGLKKLRFVLGGLLRGKRTKIRFGLILMA
ncbi:unnamed protein product [Rhizophagus irregularis]|nr:unnamed protein product [Rhizophagus irregularis]